MAPKSSKKTTKKKTDTVTRKTVVPSSSKGSPSHSEVAREQMRGESPIELNEQGEPVVAKTASTNRELTDEVEVVMDLEPAVQVTPESTVTETLAPWQRMVQKRQERGKKRVEEVAEDHETPGSPEYEPESMVAEDPEGTLGEPDTRKPRFQEVVEHAWAPYPRNMSSFTWDELRATGRTDATIIYQATDTEQFWATNCRSKWMFAQLGRYQVPRTLFSDRVFLREPKDAVYLENMHKFLRGETVKQPILDEMFWRYDLRMDKDSSAAKEAITRIRSEWALTMGFKKIITFEDYEAMRDDSHRDQKNVYDVCTVEGRRKITKFWSKVAWTRLPKVFEKWIGVMGLAIKMPRLLYYFGSEYMQPSHFEGMNRELIEMALEYEVLHALMCAIFHESRYGVAWVMSESCVQFLEDNKDAMSVPADDGMEICASLVAEKQRGARGLTDDYLFERRDYPSQHQVRWVVLHDGEFVKAREFAGHKYNSYPVVQTQSHGWRGGPSARGYRSMQESARGPTAAMVLVSIPRAPSTSHSLHVRLNDAALRAFVDAEFFVRELDVRDSGWPVHEVLSRAMGMVKLRDLALKSSREEITRLREENGRLSQELDRADPYRRERGSQSEFMDHDYGEHKRPRLRHAPYDPEKAYQPSVYHGSALGSTVTGYRQQGHGAVGTSQYPSYAGGSSHREYQGGASASRYTSQAGGTGVEQRRYTEEEEAHRARERDPYGPQS